MNRDKAILPTFLFVGMLTMLSVPLWLSIGLVAILLIAPIILKIPVISSLTSHLPSLNPTNILWVLAIISVVSAIILLIFCAFPLINYIGNDYQEDFANNKSKYPRNFDSETGQARIEDEELLIFGKAGISNDDVSYLSSYQKTKFQFDVLVVEGKTAFVEIVFRDVKTTRETSFSFIVEHSNRWRTIEFGVDDHDRIWAKDFGRDPINLQKSSKFFDDSKPFDVIVKITGDGINNPCSVKIDNVGLGA